MCVSLSRALPQHIHTHNHTNPIQPPPPHTHIHAHTLNHAHMRAHTHLLLLLLLSPYFSLSLSLSLSLSHPHEMGQRTATAGETQSTAVLIGRIQTYVLSCLRYSSPLCISMYVYTGVCVCVHTLIYAPLIYMKEHAAICSCVECGCMSSHEYE